LPKWSGVWGKKVHEMSRLLEGLGNILKPTEQPTVEIEQSIAAMDAAMQEAIERHTAEKAAAVDEDVASEPQVLAPSGPRQTFGRRRA